MALWRDKQRLQPSVSKWPIVILQMRSAKSDVDSTNRGDRLERQPFLRPQVIRDVDFFHLYLLKGYKCVEPAFAGHFRADRSSSALKGFCTYTAPS
jgi:hypothetical protein